MLKDGKEVKYVETIIEVFVYDTSEIISSFPSDGIPQTCDFRL